MGIPNLNPNQQVFHQETTIVRLHGSGARSDRIPWSTSRRWRHARDTFFDHLVQYVIIHDGGIYSYSNLTIHNAMEIHAAKPIFPDGSLCETCKQWWICETWCQRSKPKILQSDLWQRNLCPKMSQDVPRCPKMSQDLSRHHFLNPIPSWVLTSPFDCMACLGLSFPITGSSFPATRTAMDSTSSWCQLLKDLESGISHLQSLTMITNNNFEPWFENKVAFRRSNYVSGTQQAGLEFIPGRQRRYGIFRGHHAPVIADGRSGDQWWSVDPGGRQTATPRSPHSAACSAHSVTHMSRWGNTKL